MSYLDDGQQATDRAVNCTEAQIRRCLLDLATVLADGARSGSTCT